MTTLYLLLLREEAGEDVEEATEEKEVKEEEPAEMTLDEWKAMQVGQQKNPSFNLRKAGEGKSGCKSYIIM